MTPADALRRAIEEATDLEVRTRAAAHACRRHPNATVRQSTADAHAEAVARLVALRAPGTPTDDEVAEDVLALLQRIRAHVAGDSPIHPGSTKRAA